jgi:exonuclease SbcC
MKISKIKISNLFGIKEQNLDGKSIEITGSNGQGKTSILDAIRYALTNSSERDYIVKKGESEGEILIETDTGLSINRKKRTQSSDYKSIKQNEKEINSPESFLKEIFTPMQLNPVEFTQMSKQEQNRIILDLIEFDWDLNWIKEKFGEIPSGVDYSQNILEVLNEIQSEDGEYYKARQDINRDIRNNRAFISDIADGLPEKYDAEKWEKFNLTEKLKELMTIKEQNARINEAKQFIANYDNKVKGYEAERQIAISAEEKNISIERENLQKEIARLEEQIKADKEKLNNLDNTLEDRKKIANLEYEKKIAALDESIGRAKEFSQKTPVDITEMQAECDLAEKMKSYINEYKRMKEYEKQIEELNIQSQEYTRKIELARNLPRRNFKNSYYSS